MRHNIFTSTKHWKFSLSDQVAEQRFKELQASTRQKLPNDFYQRPLAHLDLMRQSCLYSLLKTLPKGVMHHNHYAFNDDPEFYQTYILTDNRVYLTPDLSSFAIGPAKQAQQKGWISMQSGVQIYGKDQWLQRVVDLTAFSKQQLKQMDYKSTKTWQIFQKKIITSMKLLMVRDIFEKYSKHMLEKYIKNGYDRAEFRCAFSKLTEYDEEGNFVKNHQESVIISSLEKVVQQVEQKYPNFSCGFILAGFKVANDKITENTFRMACKAGWKRLIGFDFVQQEDKYQSLERYDPIVDRVLQEFPQLCHLKKVYHAGETTNHLTNNIDVAVKAGTVRIGHGLNILQRIQFLPHCKHICFQKNPLSNLILGYINDLRQASAPILVGLGYPVSISPDDPGKFGYQDSTADYFVAALSYNWSLRHLKLIGYHSINHAVCEESEKVRLIECFEKSWDEWVRTFLEVQHVEAPQRRFQYEDIFSFSKNWQFQEKEKIQSDKFGEQVDKIIANTPENIYQNSFIDFKKTISESPLFAVLKSMPKGTLQSCHFIFNHDSQFMRKCIIPFHNIYLNEYSKELMIATPKEGEVHSWTSLQHLKLQYEADEDLANFLYSLTSFTSEELREVTGHQKEFHRIKNKKTHNLLTLLTSEAIFKKYAGWVLQKLAGQGYLRVEFRLEPIKLIEYSESGELLIQYGYKRMIEIIDQEYLKIADKYPHFTVCFIILGNKSFTRDQNLSIFEQLSSLKWQKVIGFDLEQQMEEKHAPLSQYTDIIDSVLINYDDISYWRLYQAGNSSDHSNSNIEIALKNGSRRICNGLNILQHISLLSKCRDVCFQVNPILNLAQGASKRTDFRLSIAPILLGLGFPVTISSDMMGLIGFEETTYDIFLAAISFNWSLKHIKLMLLHSVNYAAVTEGRRGLMLKEFNTRWNKWINEKIFQ